MKTCVNMDGTHGCECNIGYQLDQAAGYCIDINECNNRSVIIPTKD